VFWKLVISITGSSEMILYAKFYLIMCTVVINDYLTRSNEVLTLLNFLFTGTTFEVNQESKLGDAVGEEFEIG
jgi:hypothetical protein